MMSSSTRDVSADPENPLVRLGLWHAYQEAVLAQEDAIWRYLHPSGLASGVPWGDDGFSVVWFHSWDVTRLARYRTTHAVLRDFTRLARLGYVEAVRDFYWSFRLSREVCEKLATALILIPTKEPGHG